MHTGWTFFLPKSSPVSVLLPHTFPSGPQYNTFMWSPSFSDEYKRMMNSEEVVTAGAVLSGRMATWFGAGLPSSSPAAFDSRLLKAGRDILNK